MELLYDPLDERGPKAVPVGSVTVDLKGDVASVACQTSSIALQGGSLIHRCRNQQELLQLLALVPENSALKVIPGPGLEPLDALPVLSLGLKSLEVLAADVDPLSQEEWVGSVLQGSGGADGTETEDLGYWMSRVLPGGCYRIVIDSDRGAPPFGSSSAPALPDYLVGLAVWIADGSRCQPPHSWWLDVERIEFQLGYATLWKRSECAQTLSPDRLSSGNHGRVAEVIEEMQNELDRVFNLYSTAYHVAESRRLEIKDLLARLAHARRLLVRYRLASGKAMSAIHRLLRVSVNQCM